MKSLATIDEEIRAAQAELVAAMEKQNNLLLQRAALVSPLIGQPLREVLVAELQNAAPASLSIGQLHQLAQGSTPGATYQAVATELSRLIRQNAAVTRPQRGRYAWTENL